MNIRDTRMAIIDVINKSGMPIDVISLLMESITNNIARQVEIAYAQEAANAARNQEDKDNKKKDVSTKGSDK